MTSLDVIIKIKEALERLPDTDGDGHFADVTPRDSSVSMSRDVASALIEIADPVLPAQKFIIRIEEVP